ncbi:MAG: putative Ig domain-containing protein, partial [Woeseia sp.]
TTVALPSFAITVNAYYANNAAPTISGAPRTAVGFNQWYAFQPLTSDANDHSLSYSIRRKPAWATFDAHTGRLHGRPSWSDRGTYNNIAISVTDGKGTAALPPFAVTVASGAGSNSSPVIGADAPAKVVAGNAYWAQFDANDADGDPLTFSIRNKPSWATFWPGSGQLFGTPDNSDIGLHGQIIVEVTDGQSTTALPAFAIRVHGSGVSNGAPTISGDPALTVRPGGWYDFQPTASDPDDHALSYSIQNKPWWAEFNVNTGRLYGSPGMADDRAYRNIQVRVTDGIAIRSLLPAFTIDVGNGGSSDLGLVNLSWTPPTQNTDGTALTNLSGYRIYYGTAPGNYPNRITINNANDLNHVVENLAP